ncbi:MAG: O-antigen ligase family protein, partial [bacterium]|nr:O-antigen ligase family protein [bacterium]
DNKEIFGYLLIPLFLVMIHSEKRLRHALTAVLASAVASSLLGISQALIKGVSLDHRLQGATSHWMTYSGLLMFSFIFFFVFLFHEKQKKRKIIIALSLVVILTAILLSLTRSVWVGIAVSVSIFIVYTRPRILYLAVPALILLVLVLPPSVKTRVTSIFDLQNATNKDRLYMAQIAFSIFKDYPITGVGPNNIEKVYDRYKPAGADLSNMHLHNNFLHVLAERGLLALLILVIAFIAVFAGIVKKMKRSVHDHDGSPPHLLYQRTVATGVLFAFIGFLTAGMFEYNFGDSEVKFLLFFFISLPFLSFFSAPSASSAVKNPQENSHD